MRFRQFAVITLVFGMTAAICSRSWAVAYASYVHDTGVPNQKEFVLNDTADSITILRNGGNAITLGSTAPGRVQFDMTGFSTWEIQVKKNEATPSANNTLYREVSCGTVNAVCPVVMESKFNHFERGSDVLVDNNPASPTFGTIYVNNVRTTAAAGALGRAMGDGIYSLSSNLVGVDLTTTQAIANADDATLAKKAANWNLGDKTITVSGFPVTVLGNVSGWRMSYDSAGNIMMGDWSDANGGIKWINRTLTSGGLGLKFQDGIVTADPNGAADPPVQRLGLLTNGSGQEVHGSIPGHVNVLSGSVGNNLVVAGLDEDYDLDGNTFNTTGNTGNHVWKWNVGNAMGTAADGSDAYDQSPTLVINTANLPAATNVKTDDIGGVGTKSNWLALNVGIQSDAIYSPAHNKWYMTQNRSAGNEAGLIVVTADNVDGNSPTLNWSSMQFTADNNLDGAVDDPATATINENIAGTQDVFRQMAGGMTLSPDGRTLYVHHLIQGNGVAAGGSNPVLGTLAPAEYRGSVLAIPLTEAGIPDMTVSGGVITNIKTVSTASNTGTGLLRGVTLDAAGNIYTTNNSSERLQVWSPLGNFITTLKSDGTFNVGLVPAGLPGDFNNDTVVDSRDYVLWRKLNGTASTLNGHGDETGGSANFVDAADYNLWVANYGKSLSGSGGGVPEPASVMLVVAGMFALCGVRRRAAA